ncbi:MAG: RHS repeat-associated core domain-containing protein [Lachnospiraceae bacterium]|nr:RHS repeat-associated core domain-containing protein [Lachnospiraceae bacterium]
MGKTYTSGGKLKTEQYGERVTTYDTDGRDRRKKEKLAGGASTTYSYDNITNDVKEEKKSFRQPGRENANTLTAKYTYDEYGNVIKETDKADKKSETIVTETEYDTDGRFIVSNTDSRGNISYSRYDTDTGLLTGMTDTIGISTEYAYNAFHHLTGVSSEGDEVRYEYDDKYHDRLEGVSISAGADPFSGEAFSFKYDKYGNVSQISLEGTGKLVSYSYMPNNGKLKQTAYGNGNKVSYTYNDLEQLKKESYGPSGAVTYEYDNRGNVARITDEHNSDSKGLFKWGKEKYNYRYDYDDHGRVTAASITKKAGNKKEADKEVISFQNIYDKAGRPSVFAYYTNGKSYRTEYGYSSDDKAAAATLPSGGVFKRTYDDFERITKDEFTPQKKAATGESAARGNGATVVSTYGYISTDRGGDGEYTTRLLNKVETVVGSGKNAKKAVSDTLGYDKLGRIDAFNGMVYNYDDLGRLIKAEDNVRVWTYSYDVMGNLTGSTLCENGKVISDEAYSYKNGSLTAFNKEKIGGYKGGNPKKYRGYTLEWEKGRQLKGVKAGKGRASAGFCYDHDGIRISKTTGDKKNQAKTEYITNGSMILSEKRIYAGGEEILNYYYSPEGRLLEIGYSRGKEEEHHYSVIRNAMGDVAALYTADGILVGTYEYDPYGKLLGETKNTAYEDVDGILAKNPFRYRGYYYDSETGWYYLQSRYYDPEVKRFINADSTDLITCDYMSMMQYNLFMYCNGDPVNGVDPSGQFEVLVRAGIGALVGGCAGVVGQALTDIIACSLSDDYEVCWESYAGAFVGGAAGGAVLATTGNIRAANFATGFVTTGSTNLIKNMTGRECNSASDIIIDSTCDGMASLAFGEILNTPISNKINSSQNTYVGKLMSNNNNIFGEIGYKMRPSDVGEGIISNIGGGFRLDVYYGVRPYTDNFAKRYYHH